MADPASQRVDPGAPAAPSSAPEPTAPPVRFGPFRLHRLIGRGAGTEVWFGEDSDGHWAIKRLWPHLAGDAGARRRLAHEAALLRAAGGWPAPTLRTHDGDAATAPLPYLARSHIDGATLAQLGGDATASAPILAAAATALAHLHDRGLVCGDVTPGNLVCDGGGRVWTVDLGLAAAPGVQAPWLAGVATPAFAPPEVLAGARATWAADVFAFASVCAWLVGRSLPWSGLVGPARAAAIGQAQIHAATAASAWPQLPHLAAWFHAAWALDPAARPPLASARAAWAPGADPATAAARVRAVATAAAQERWYAPIRAAEDRGEIITGPEDSDATRLTEG